MTTPQPDVLALAKAMVREFYTLHLINTRAALEEYIAAKFTAALTSAVAAQQEELRRLREALEQIGGIARQAEVFHARLGASDAFAKVAEIALRAQATHEGSEG
jgi:hypothetical protein